jgi:hypothetical protein
MSDVSSQAITPNIIDDVRTSNSISRDPFSAIILLLCVFASAVLGITGIANFFTYAGKNRLITDYELMESVRTGLLPEEMMSLAYNEVKRMTGTSPESQLEWLPSVTSDELGMLVLGKTRMRDGSPQDFVVRFTPGGDRIIASVMEPPKK